MYSMRNNVALHNEYLSVRCNKESFNLSMPLLFTFRLQASRRGYLHFGKCHVL